MFLGTNQLRLSLIVQAICRSAVIGAPVTDIQAEIHQREEATATTSDMCKVTFKANLGMTVSLQTFI